MVVAAAHSVTLDTGRASPLFAIDNRHSARSRPNAVVAGGDYSKSVPSLRLEKARRKEQAACDTHDGL